MAQRVQGSGLVRLPRDVGPAQAAATHHERLIYNFISRNNSRAPITSDDDCAEGLDDLLESKTKRTFGVCSAECTLLSPRLQELRVHFGWGRRLKLFGPSVATLRPPPALETRLGTTVYWSGSSRQSSSSAPTASTSPAPSIRPGTSHCNFSTSHVAGRHASSKANGWGGICCVIHAAS